MTAPRFYVGAHHLHLLWHDAMGSWGDALTWLEQHESLESWPDALRSPVDWARSLGVESHDQPVRLFVSYNELARRRSPLPPIRARWALDSGAFTRLTSGRGHAGLAEFVDAVRAGRRGGLHRNGMEFACIQDWPAFACQQTGLALADHQRRTADSLVLLSAAAPEVCWAPVLIGNTPGELDAHLGMYLARGRAVHGGSVTPVALGGFAQRLDDPRLPALVDHLRGRGVAPLHVLGMGASGAGLAVDSGDSMAWSATFRRERIRLPGHRHGRRGGDCRNCPTALLVGLFTAARALDAGARGQVPADGEAA